MLEKVIEVLREQLNLDDMVITADSNFRDDIGADSLDLLEVVMALEEEYGIDIPAEELTEIATVGDVVDYLTEKGIEV